jgi:hypothetical protein
MVRKRTKLAIFATSIYLVASCGPRTSNYVMAPSHKPTLEPSREVAPHGSAISGRVLFGGRPVRYFGVTVTSNFAGVILGHANVFHAADGRFRVAVPEAGSWDLIIAGPGFARRVLAGNEVEEGKTRDVGDVVVARGHTIRGVVRDAGGAPMPSADIALVATEFSDVSGELDQLARGNIYTRTDDRGAYEIEGSAIEPLAIGTPQISATTRDRRASLPTAVPDSDTRIDLTVGLTGTLEIAVTGSVQTTVIVNPVGNHSVSLPVHQIGDVYRLDVPVGDYEIATVLIGQTVSLQRRQVSVSAGAIAAVTIAVPPIPSVPIKVHADLACDEMQLYARADAPVATAKCVSGDAEFAQVEPGVYMACSITSGKRACESFVVGESTASQQFDLNAP